VPGTPGPLTDFDTSITINPTIAYAFCARASLRATCSDEKFRDGQLALDDARTAFKLAEEAGNSSETGGIVSIFRSWQPHMQRMPSSRRRS
jgi:hypothetical protein